MVFAFLISPDTALTRFPTELHEHVLWHTCFWVLLIRRNGWYRMHVSRTASPDTNSSTIRMCEEMFLWEWCWFLSWMHSVTIILFKSFISLSLLTLVSTDRLVYPVPLSWCLSDGLTACLSIFFSVYEIHLSALMSVYLYVWLSLCVCLPVHCSNSPHSSVLIYLLVHSFACLSLHLAMSVCLSTCPTA